MTEPTPCDVLAEVASIRRELEEVTLWSVALELDGEPATVRRAIDVALGDSPPVFLEVAPGVVLELDPHNPGGNTP